jgi:hypothetical protein
VFNFSDRTSTEITEIVEVRNRFILKNSSVVFNGTNEISLTEIVEVGQAPSIRMYEKHLVYEVGVINL